MIQVVFFCFFCFFFVILIFDIGIVPTVCFFFSSFYCILLTIISSPIATLCLRTNYTTITMYTYRKYNNDQQNNQKQHPQFLYHSPFTIKHKQENEDISGCRQKIVWCGETRLQDTDPPIYESLVWGNQIIGYRPTDLRIR